MPKFYVQSGLVSHIVTANDAFSAALWTMHLVMEDVVPVDQVDWLSEEDQPEHGFADGLMKLGETIAVSEVGWSCHRSRTIEGSVRDQGWRCCG